MTASPEHVPLECRVYRRRWIVLAIFMGFGFISSAQWVQFSIISNVVMRFYNVSSYAVDWTGMIFSASYCPFIFPASYILDTWGLRKSLLLGVGMMTLGTWVKCFSAVPSRYAVTLTGQTMVGTSQVFLLSVPPRIAARWFGSDQVSTACSLGILGLQIGVGVGFLLPPIMVRDHSNLEDVGFDLALMFYIVAGISTVLFVLAVFLFQEKPPLPPSVESYLQSQTKFDFRAALCRLFRDRNFLLLMASYSVNLAVFNTFSTLLNQYILNYFPNGQVFSGRVGLVFVITGMVGAVICGVLLDKTHRFRETIIAIYSLSTVALLVFTFIMAVKSQLLVYIVGGIFGTFMGAYMTVSFEYGVELMYPESESTMAGMLLLGSQVLTVVLTLAYGWLLNETGPVWANMALCAALAAGTLATALIHPHLRRQAAHAGALGTPAPLERANAHTHADGENDEAPEALKLVPA